MTSDKTPILDKNISKLDNDEFHEIITPLGENVGECAMSVRSKSIEEYLKTIRKNQKEGEFLKRQMELVNEMIEEIERIKKGSVLQVQQLEKAIEEFKIELEEEGVDPDLLFLELSKNEPVFKKFI